jgi:hypothetical protein
MKLSKSKLKQIIKEELGNVLYEAGGAAWQVPPDWRGVDAKSRRNLQLLRNGKWGSNWIAYGQTIEGDSGFWLQIMGSTWGENALFVNKDEGLGRAVAEIRFKKRT